MEFRYIYVRHTLGNLSALGLLKTSAQDKINPVLSSLHLFLSPPSVTRFCEISLHWQNYLIFVKWLRDYLVFGKILDLLWQHYFVFDSFSMFKMGKYWKTFQASGHTAPSLRPSCRNFSNEDEKALKGEKARGRFWHNFNVGTFLSDKTEWHLSSAEKMVGHQFFP